MDGNDDPCGSFCSFRHFSNMDTQQAIDRGFYDSSRRRDQEGELVEQEGNSGIDVYSYHGCFFHGGTIGNNRSFFQNSIQLDHIQLVVSEGKSNNRMSIFLSRIIKMLHILGCENAVVCITSCGK